jgi:hypothetical protein
MKKTLFFVGFLAYSLYYFYDKKQKAKKDEITEMEMIY